MAARRKGREGRGGRACIISRLNQGLGENGCCVAALPTYEWSSADMCGITTSIMDHRLQHQEAQNKTCPAFAGLAQAKPRPALWWLTLNGGPDWVVKCQAPPPVGRAKLCRLSVCVRSLSHVWVQASRTGKARGPQYMHRFRNPPSPPRRPGGAVFLLLVVTAGTLQPPDTRAVHAHRTHHCCTYSSAAVQNVTRSKSAQGGLASVGANSRLKAA